MAVRGGKSAPSRGVSHHSRPPRHSVPAPRKAPLRRAVTEVHEGECKPAAAQPSGHDEVRWRILRRIVTLDTCGAQR